MPPRSKVETILPPELRVVLDRKLVDNAFSGYEQLSEWLNNAGYSISKSAIGEHSKKLQDMRKRADARKALVDAMGGDGASYIMGVAYEVAAKLEDLIEDFGGYSEDGEGINSGDLSRLARAVSDLQKVITSGEVHVKRIKDQYKKELDELEKSLKTAKRSPDEVLAEVRKRFFGLDDSSG